MAKSLDERVALVTGGSARIGAEICRQLAESGAIVAVHCHRNLAAAEELIEEIQSKGGEAFVIRGDLSKENDRSALIEAVIDRVGRLDILVNNASIFEKIPLDEMTSDAAQMMWRVNAEAPLMLIQHAAPHLRFEGKDDPGSVINMIDNSSGVLDDDEPLEIFAGNVGPGNHSLTVEMVYRGDSMIFTYLRDYLFKLRASYTFYATKGKVTSDPLLSEQVPQRRTGRDPILALSQNGYGTHNSIQPNSNQLNATQLNPTHLTTQLKSTHDSTQLISIPNSTELS